MSGSRNSCIIQYFASTPRLSSIIQSMRMTMRIPIIKAMHTPTH
jgi:hypothetical protein